MALGETSTKYAYDVQFTNSMGRTLHVYTEAYTNVDAITQAMTQILEWGNTGAIRDIHLEILSK